MSDTISRQQAIDALDGEITITGRANVIAVKGYINLVKDRLERLPPAGPKRGKWLPDNNNYIYEQYVCSECKNSFKVDTRMGKPMWNFCPNCGAKMEEAK